jgi:fructose-specific phosphotransferase system component IIB
MREEM